MPKNRKTSHGSGYPRIFSDPHKIGELLGRLRSEAKEEILLGSPP